MMARSLQRLSLLLLLLGTTVLAKPNLKAVNRDGDHDTDLSIKEFEEKFHELISDPEKEKAAAEQLAKEEAQIKEQNEAFEEGKATFDEELNEFSDLTSDEFLEEKTGLIDEEEDSRSGSIEFGTGFLETPEEERIISPENQAILDEVYSDRQSVPSSYDARSQGLVTPVKNQQQCGSCAAFTAHATHEICMVKAGASKDGLDLSEQQLVDCAYLQNGAKACNGAQLNSYQRWMAQKSGGKYFHERDYTYRNTNPSLSCPLHIKSYSAGATIQREITDYRCNEDKMKALVARYGSVATAIQARGAFQNYRSGIFSGSSCNSRRMDHAVTVVGYGSENGVDYWLVKNSWGTGWGDQGFVKVRRGVSCIGIGKLCTVVQCRGNGSPHSPPPPPPSPPPPGRTCDISNLYWKGITGSYNLRSWINGRYYYAAVTCQNSICTPRYSWVTDACKYICGQSTCSRSSGRSSMEKVA